MPLTVLFASEASSVLIMTGAFAQSSNENHANNQVLSSGINEIRLVDPVKNFNE